MTMTHIISGAAIGIFRLKVLIEAAKLELIGLKRRGASAHALLKRELGVKGNRQSVIDQAEAALYDVTHW